jgi:hypothetical protein
VKHKKSMRRLILLFVGIFAVININAQVFRGFFKPVSEQPYFKTKEITADRNLNGVFLVRMSAGVVATQTIYDFETKSWSQTALNAVGFGLSFNHYKQLAEPYNDWSINGFLFANEKVSFALTASAWQYFQGGVIYTPGVKQIGFLTGFKYSF